VREALAQVRTAYVVCVDADTTTERPLGEMVGAVATRGLDLASVRLVVSNRGTLLSRLQAHEYRMSMRLRRVMPWLCSGACHLGRTAALREIMDRHSLFFQGNDAELGLLGHALGFRIGHLDHGVPTSVPESPRAWLRQRFAWAGGEFRLYVVNIRMALTHPWFILYGALLVFALTPLRLMSAAHPAWTVLAAVMATYWALVVLANRRHVDLALLVYPAYGLVNSLVLTPLGVISYLAMALRSGNAGVIRIRPAESATPSGAAA
jgi:cellulose synthase/poly-beta-1,6-N-acetylglucosamine synthase-like glycosyltransferase